MKVTIPQNPHGWFGKAFQIECDPEKGGRLHRVDGAAHGVYLVLVSHSNTNGITFPSVEFMAKALKYSVSKVRRGLKGLIQHGLIEVAVAGGGQGRPTKYKITPPLLLPDNLNDSREGVSHDMVFGYKTGNPETASLGNPATGDSFPGPNPVTHDSPSQSKPPRGETLPSGNPPSTGPKPCHIEPPNPSPVRPEKSKKELKQKDACCSDLRGHLEGMGVKGNKLDEISSLPDLTIEQIDAVHEEAQTKSRGDGNTIGLMITMLLDGERGDKRVAERQREWRRQEASCLSEQRAHEFLAALPEVEDMTLLAIANDWYDHFGKIRLLATARDALPELLIEDHNGVLSWSVDPSTDKRVLVACYVYDREHTTAGEKFALEWAARQQEGASF